MQSSYLIAQLRPPQKKFWRTRESGRTAVLSLPTLAILQSIRKASPPPKPATMAKKGAKLAGAPAKKKTVTEKKAKSSDGRRKSNEPVVEKIIEDETEEEWEDEEDQEEDSEEDSDEEEEGGIDFSRIDDINDSDSDSEIEDEGEADDSKFEGAESGSDDDDDEEEDIDVDDLSLSDLDEESKEELKASTRVRQTINNKDALLASLKRIALPTDPKTVPFKFHQSVVSSKPTESGIESVEDELQRELAFLNQSLEAARQARTLLRKEGVPFSRPTDYFAETLRSDETMEKVKAKMIEEATAKKASAEARKQRDLKKFGKQVQIQKQQERAKEKRETLEKINLLKRSTYFFFIIFSPLPPFFTLHTNNSFFL